MHRRGSALCRSCGCARLRCGDRHAGRGGQAGRRAGRRRRQHGAGAVGGGSRRACPAVRSTGVRAHRDLAWQQLRPGPCNHAIDPGHAGSPLHVPAGAGTATVHGWQRLQRLHIPGLGGRWLGACETPDLELFPRRYPGLRSVQVFAALEVGAFHLGLWGLSWMVRAGLLRRPERLAAPLLALKRAMRVLGSDVGGMAVTLKGASRSGGRKRIEWRLIARRAMDLSSRPCRRSFLPSACSRAR